MAQGLYLPELRDQEQRLSALREVTDAELLTACLERSGLTRRAFCLTVLAGRSTLTLRRWEQGQPIPREARLFLERYHQRLLNKAKGKLNYEAGLLKRGPNVAT